MITLHLAKDNKVDVHIALDETEFPTMLIVECNGHTDKCRNMCSDLIPLLRGIVLTHHLIDVVSVGIDDFIPQNGCLISRKERGRYSIPATCNDKETVLIFEPLWSWTHLGWATKVWITERAFCYSWATVDDLLPKVQEDFQKLTK